jgi:hypothetical protein
MIDHRQRFNRREAEFNKRRIEGKKKIVEAECRWSEIGDGVMDERREIKSGLKKVISRLLDKDESVLTLS